MSLAQRRIRPRARIILPAWVQFVVSGVQLSRAEVEVPAGCSPLDPDSVGIFMLEPCRVIAPG